MPVHLPRSTGARRLVSGALTVAAVLLLVVPATLGDPVDETRVSTLVRLPVEPLLLLAVVLALPAGRPRLRTAVAAGLGGVLGLALVFRGLDLGFLRALNRPFDPLIDWRYAGSLVGLLRDSFGPLLGTALLVGAVVAAVAALLLLPLAAVRVAGVAARHRPQAAAVTAVLLAGWLVVVLVGVPGPAGSLATADTLRYVHHEVARVPGQLADLREFEAAARDDPAADVAPEDLVTALRGKDVLVVFVESYGRVALEDPALAPGVDRVLARGTRDLTDAGFDARSAWLTSPTFGALSWLAHATLQSGLWVDSQPRYDAVVTSRRLTLSRLFARAGWRTVAVVPANDRDWPQAEFYDFDHVYDSRNLGYRGPRFGYPTMPDQYTLEALQRLELEPRPRPPVMAEVDLITSHAPWSRVPLLVDQATVGDGSVFDGMPSRLDSATDIWPDPTRIRAAYGHAIEYSLSALVRFLTTYGDDDLVVVVLGDHQPATVVSGDDAGREVPVTLLARDPAVLAAVDPWAWEPGLRPDPEAPVWRMDAFRDRFLTAFGTTPAP
ncbi:hypothetical protein GCM10009623_17530 [Nocardioides aestuarii]|uniref:Sulfatase-like hydrolase/transferase n=1 Tax=Nocardioides aestuarii TaxID=252231 RepID=A0ABW4TMP1_9ACTN